MHMFDCNSENMRSNFITRAWKKRKTKKEEKELEKQRLLNVKEKHERLRMKVMERYDRMYLQRLEEEKNKLQFRRMFMLQLEQRVENVKKSNFMAPPPVGRNNPFSCNPFLGDVAEFNPRMEMETADDCATCDESPWSLVELQGERNTPTGENWATFQ